MKILHFSDTHLGAKRYGLNESYNDFNKAFDEVIKYIDELKPDIVIHSGDLFDKSKPTPLTLREAFSKIIKVSKQVPFLIIPGNHDFSVSIGISPISLLSIDNDKIKVTEQRDIFENGRINVEKIKFQFDGINFFLIPYFHNSGVLRNCIDQILDSLNPNEINLLILHQIVSQEVLRRKNKVFSNVDIPFENLESFDFVFLGHFHSPLFLNN
ncbi:MAG: DNA repair exonuclease, partial [candidate division WOR-3 bacterium]